MPTLCAGVAGRAFHTLSRAERDKVYAALWVLHETPTWEGRHTYGKGYLDWSDLVMFHAVAAGMPEGDAAHPLPGDVTQQISGAAFAPWHRAFELVFENILLLVDPSIGAAPYWDVSAETRGHPLFTPSEWGSVPGNGPLGEMLDGKFANWTVSAASHPHRPHCRPRRRPRRRRPRRHLPRRRRPH